MGSAGSSLERSLGLSLVLAGCILENNPAFSNGVGTTSSAQEVTGQAGTGTGLETGSAESEAGSSDGGPGFEDDPNVGCNTEDCEEFHVGIEPGDCAREENGQPIETCDFFGADGLEDAVMAASIQGGARVLVHDRNGNPATFDGVLVLGQNTSVRPYAGVPRDRIRIRGNATTPAVIHMVGDSNHIRDVTIVCAQMCERAFEFAADVEAGELTGGHLIERVEIAATYFEHSGANGIFEPFRALGPDTEIRNTHLWGYFNGNIDLSRAVGSKIHHNSWLFYQARVGNFVFEVDDATDVEISNNVFASLVEEVPALVDGSPQTQELVVVGNLLEGFESLSTGLEHLESTFSNNTIGQLPLEGPHRPLMLSDTEVVVAEASDGGTSLDEVTYGGQADALPGAFQVRSDRAGPRRMTVRFGSEDECGSQPCDVASADVNPLQTAIFSAWPGAVIEIYPGTYAGGVSSWPLEIRGMGVQPEEVVLEPRTNGFFGEADLLPTTETLRILFLQPAGTTLSNLTIDAVEDGHGLFVEGDGFRGARTSHLVERVRVTGSDARSGFVLGSNVVVRNSFIEGSFAACVDCDARQTTVDPFATANVVLQNVTCRVQSPSLKNYPDAAFRIPGVSGLSMINVVAEVGGGVPFFEGQSPPLDFLVDSMSAKGGVEAFSGFEPADGTYSLANVDYLDVGDPLFAEVSGGHLDGAAVTALDNGVDPSTIDSSLEPAIALDGVDRAAAGAIDRGCFEQGL